MNFKNTVKFQFEGNLEYYPATYSQLNNYKQQAMLIKNLIRQRGLNFKDTSILELGCGCGDLFSYLQEIKELVGVDKSKKLIKIAKMRNLKNATFICKDFTTLKLKKLFDVIFISTFLIQTFPSEYKLKNFLSKIKLWLNDRGFILFDWMDEEIYSKIFRDGKSKRIFLKKSYSFEVLTKKIKNKKRFFQIIFYKNNKKILSGKAIYLCITKRELTRIIKAIGLHMKFLNDSDIPYKKFIFLYK
jgi:SAM-dependent methyltransferase